MPGYVLAGLMGVTLLLPAAIAYVVHEMRSGLAGEVGVAVGILAWMLAIGACITVWTASAELYPGWWAFGDGIIGIPVVFGIIGNLAAVLSAILD